MRIEVASENSLIIYFGDTVSPEISAKVQLASQKLAIVLGDLLVDQVASYASILLIYDPLRCDHLMVRSLIREALSNLDIISSEISSKTNACVELPVYYSEESGPDLKLISKRSGLSISKIIELHQATSYRVYAIGFAPGFAFLGQIDARIATPRLKTPRLKVPRGAVAIADRQTAIYPDVSPGGWNLIGLCPTPMFTPDSTPHMPITVGDEVRFKAIDLEEFIDLGGELGIPI